MSRHTFETQHNGRPVKLLCGWDRPLGGYFMSVRLTDVPQNQNGLNEEEDEVIFDSLDYGNGHESTFEPFIHVLSKLDISLPEEMLDSLYMDGVFNVGNRVVHHFVNSDGIYACCET